MSLYVFLLLCFLLVLKHTHTNMIYFCLNHEKCDLLVSSLCCNVCKDALQETVLDRKFNKCVSCDKSRQWHCGQRLSFMFLYFYAFFLLKFKNTFIMFFICKLMFLTSVVYVAKSVIRWRDGAVGGAPDSGTCELSTPSHALLRSNLGDWKRGTGKRGTRLQGWKTRE